MKALPVLLLLAGLTASFAPLRAQQPVRNPGFELGTSPWIFFTTGAGTFTTAAGGYASPHAGRVTIAAPGDNIQLYQHDLGLESRHQYRLRFRALSSSGHDLSVSLHQHAEPYTACGLEHRVLDLGTAWRQFEIEFVTPAFTATCTDARLRFWLAPYAAAGDEYLFDDVELTPIGPEPVPPRTWAMTFGGPWAEGIEDVRQTADDGYIVAGSTWSFSTGYYDFWVLKLRADASVAWQKAYGGSAWDLCTSVAQADDGGYLVAGWTESFGAGSKDGWVLKLRPDGSLEWERTYGGSAAEELHAAVNSADAGYLLAGWTESFGAGGRDAMLVKLGTDGTIGWQRTLGGTGSDELTSAQATADGGYILAGSTESFGTGARGAWVVKLTPGGAVQWQRKFEGAYWNGAHSAREVSGGGYIVSARTAGDAWILRLDGNGSLLWQSTYGGADLDNYHDSYAQETMDGGFIVGGHTLSFGAGSTDIWLMKLRNEGSVVWQTSYGGTEWEGATSLEQTSDGGYLLAGSTVSFGAGHGDMWILKLDSTGGCSHCPAARPTAAVRRSAAVATTVPTASPVGAGASTSISTSVQRNTAAEAVQICPADNSIVLNPGFERGTAPWRFHTDGGGSFRNDAPGASSPRAAHITITASGSNVQLYQSELMIQPATSYRLSFRARSSSGHDVAVHLQKHTAPYTPSGLPRWVADLTPEWQQYSRVFRTDRFETTVADTRLRFSLGPYAAAGDEYFLDDVTLEWLGALREQASGDAPSAAGLAQNYPNPFNPATTITYTVPPGPARRGSLRVYDLIGREVAVLVDDVMTPGTWTVTWNARSLAAGVYFGRFVAGDLVWTKKMILLK
jgi:hypothetical protein